MIVMIKTQKKETGSFYTCLSVADYIVKWAIIDKNTKILEPSFGDGTFLYSAINRFNELNKSDPIIYGVEIQNEPFNNFKRSNSIVHCTLTDFMDYTPNSAIDAVIGNPPYISLRNLSSNDRQKAISLMNSYNIEMSPSGSLWMPFVVHATEMLDDNGRIGFVLPYEMTYVRYAFKLWDYLKNNYSNIHIYRIYKDFFPEVDVETILFLADGKGGNTDSIKYKIFDSTENLLLGNSTIDVSIPIKDITQLSKPFEWELISPKTKDFISTLRCDGKLTPLKDECKFKIGYVCGNKEYFHPTEKTVKEYQIKESNLIPCLINSKEINRQKQIGLDTLASATSNNLFYPIEIGEGEKKYITYGERKKVNLAYKCKVRKPWYITPAIEIPDVILTVFGDIPRLIANSKGYAVSNSLLCGIISAPQKLSAKELICRWYNSLTLLLIELYIHSLGGGTLVLIPGEMDKMELISGFPECKINEVFDKLNSCIISNGTSATYSLGDELVLKQVYNFKDSDIQEIRSSLEKLRLWRRPDLRR